MYSEENLDMKLNASGSSKAVAKPPSEGGIKKAYLFAYLITISLGSF